MSKTKKQKAAEEVFESVMEFYDIDLNANEYKLIRKLCVEMYKNGFEDAVYEVQGKFGDLTDRLT